MAEEIATLNAKITVIEVKRDGHLPDSQAFTNYTNEITAIRNQITALITSQQGNLSSVSSHISIVLSQSSRCNPLPPFDISFDISSSPIQVRQSRKVRGD
jgi:hypothetical protein